MTENSIKGKMVNEWIFYFLMTLPVLTGFLYVHLFGVNVVWNDEWELANLFFDLSSGRLTVLEVWEPHNEHRFFFPNVTILVLGTLTEWNTIAEMYLIQVCLFATLITLLVAFKAGIGPRPPFFVPIAFLVFSLVQSFNMLWGLQITFFFVETFGVLAFFFLFLLGRGNRKRFAFPAALTSGTIATFSAVQGLLVWPVGLLQLFVVPVERSRKKVLVAIWSLIGLGEWIVYFIGLTAKPTPSVLLYPLTHPIAGGRYFLTLLSSSLVSPQWELDTLAFLVGLLLAGLVTVSAILIFRSGRVGEYSFWMALLLFSLFVLMAILAGRFGAQGSPPSRYATFSILATISVYAILAKAALEDRSRAVVALFGTLCVVVLLCIPVSYYKGIETGDALENRKERAAFVLYTYRSQPDKCLTIVRKTNAHTLRTIAPKLERLEYNVFSEPRVTPPPHLRCPG